MASIIQVSFYTHIDMFRINKSTKAHLNLGKDTSTEAIQNFNFVKNRNIEKIQYFDELGAYSSSKDKHLRVDKKIHSPSRIQN